MGKINKARAIERHVNIHVDLAEANRFLLGNAKKKNDGYLYECLASLILSAFKFEAYLNYALKKLFKLETRSPMEGVKC